MSILIKNKLKLMATEKRLISMEVKDYKPICNIDNDGNDSKYIDDMSIFPKYGRNCTTYKCGCKADTFISSRPQFMQHIKTETHRSWVSHYPEYLREADAREREIKELRTKLGLCENENKRIKKTNKDISDKNKTLSTKNAELIQEIGILKAEINILKNDGLIKKHQIFNAIEQIFENKN